MKFAKTPDPLPSARGIQALLNPSPELLTLLQADGNWQEYPVCFEHKTRKGTDRMVVLLRPELLKEVLQYEESF